MAFNKKSAELLAPAGTWDALSAAVEAGADAVYLGGKHFNMRMHEGEFNFDDELLKKAVDFAHEHEVKLYVTINNLISEEELPELRKYLSYLGNEVKPDALLVQDFAVIRLVRELGVKIPLHASVMMNTHNEYAIRKLKEYGVTRTVMSREMTLDEVALLRAKTGMETEYFMHGDMCIAESGQCIHSGVLFGQSGNRGRCLKPCRWKYRLIDEKTGRTVDGEERGLYRLALKDMCMLLNIPELISSGVYSFKIEGRMRPPEFVRRIVAAYRKAMDDYFADPAGYKVNEDIWRNLYENRARDFTTSFALGKPTVADIGLGGEREPRFFSKAVKEAEFADDILQQERPIETKEEITPRLSVRVADFLAAKSAVVSGANVVYVGGESFLPNAPWTRNDYEQIIEFAHKWGAKVVLATPRTTTARECAEMKDLFADAEKLGFDGVMAGNLGMLKLAYDCTDLPVQTDTYFNLFNSEAARFLAENDVFMAASSFEMSFAQLRDLAENSPLPIETVVHGSVESMICDHNIPAMAMKNYNRLNNPAAMEQHFALKDEAGEIHSLRLDQYGRCHIYFGKDLCLYPYLKKFKGIASYRIEGQDYSPQFTALVTKTYRDAITSGETDKEAFAMLKAESPRKFGIGVYRFRQSRNSL